MASFDRRECGGSRNIGVEDSLIGSPQPITDDQKDTLLEAQMKKKGYSAAI